MPERDKNAPGSLESDGVSGNSIDATCAAIQDDIDAILEAEAKDAEGR